MAKKKTKRKTKKKMARKTGKKRGARGRPALSGLSTNALQAELERRQAGVAKLESRREALLGELAELDAEIESLGGSASGASAGAGRAKRGPGRPRGRRPGGGGGRTAGGRPRNEKNLVESLEDLLKNQVLSVTDIAEEVQRAGYRTTSPNFRTIVNQTLINSGRFKRVGRGQYTVK